MSLEELLAELDRLAPYPSDLEWPEDEMERVDVYLTISRQRRALAAQMGYSAIDLIRLQTWAQL